MKKIFSIGVFLISFNVISQKINWIPFNWEGAEIEGKYFDKLFITIPVTLDNLPHAFNMQFDLGAVNTIIYGNSFKDYLAKYPTFNAKYDTTMRFRIQSQTNYMFKNVNFKLGKVTFGNRNIGLFKGFGDEIPKDSINTKSSKHIGTIAPDLFENKVLIIDYPNKRIAVSASVPKQYSKASFQSFKINDGRIKIPLNMNGKMEDLMFDTGSSLFALITTKSNASNISSQPITDSLKISSWGDYYMVYGKLTDKEVRFGNKLLKPNLVYYDEMHKSDNFNKEENIWGITGNAYFLKNVVILDYANKRFGVF
jgi:hypothetical protein